MRISDWSSDVCSSDLRASVNHNLAALTERLSNLTEHMRTEQSVMLSIAETQSSLKTLLTRLAEAGQDSGLDKASKGHIRNIDLRLERLSSDLAHGRDSSVEELRSVKIRRAPV